MVKGKGINPDTLLPFSLTPSLLLNNLCNHTGTDGTATFTDSEA